MSDFDDSPRDLQDATISFVPQVGDGHRKKHRGPKRDRSLADDQAQMAGSYSAPPGFATMDNIHQHQSAPPAGYSAPPPPQANFAMPPPQPYGQPTPMMGQPVPMMGSPVMMKPPPGPDNMYPAQQPMHPAMMKGPASPDNMYPASSFSPMHHQHGMMMQQPGAMVILVQEASDLDFTAGLFECRNCMGALNAYFTPYCLGARQQNVLKTAPGNHQDPATMERVANAASSWNGCCAAALFFDVARAAAAYFFPQVVGSYWLTNGACLETFQTRQMIRSRFGIAPAQCQDCMVSMFCLPCAVNQNQVEMERRSMDPHLCCGKSEPHSNAMQPHQMR